MYRKPLLTREDALPLVGELVRFEFSNNDRMRYSGIVRQVSTRRVYFNRADSTNGELLFIAGMYVVFATTVDELRPAEEEETFTPVLWRERHTLTGEPAPTSVGEPFPAPPWHVEYAPTYTPPSPSLLDRELDDLLRAAPVDVQPRTAWVDGDVVVDELEDWERELLA